MSIAVDSSGVTIVGAVGDKQGGYSRPLTAAPSGAIGVQYAWRGWFDTFTHTGPVTPYTRAASGTQAQYKYDSSLWDHFFHFGLTFGTTHPTKDITQAAPYYSQNRSFFGLRSGEPTNGAPQHRIAVQQFTLGNITEWLRFTGSTISASAPQARFDIKQTKATGYASDAGVSLSDLSSSTSNTAWRGAFPPTPADGAKFTCGWDIRIGNINPYQVDMRLYIDTNSHPEADLMDVFTSYDFIGDVFAINLSTTSIDTDDAWVDAGDGHMLFPDRLMVGWGGPGQTFRLKKFLFRYFT